MPTNAIPVFLAVLEADDIGRELDRTLAGRPVTSFGRFALFDFGGSLFLLFRLDEHAGARAVPVDGDALAAVLPRRHIDFPDQFLGDLVG